MFVKSRDFAARVNRTPSSAGLAVEKLFKRVVPKGVTTRFVLSPSVCMCMSVCGYVELGEGRQPPPPTQHGSSPKKFFFLKWAKNCGVTYRLMASCHRPDEAVEGAMWGWPQIEVCPDRLDYSWVRLRQPLDRCLEREVSGNVLPQKGNNLSLFLA